MAGNVKARPDGYHTITPYLTVPGVTTLIDFVKQAFDATEIFRMAGPDGSVQHAEVKIGDSIVMMGEPRGQSAVKAGSFYMYVNDVDATYRRAIGAGAVSLREPADAFYGDRVGAVQDAAGNTWSLATHIEDVSPEEIRRRAQATMKA